MFSLAKYRLRMDMVDLHKLGEHPLGRQKGFFKLKDNIGTGKIKYKLDMDKFKLWD